MHYVSSAAAFAFIAVTIRDVGEWVIWAAAVSAAAGILWKNTLGPFLFRPLGRVITDALDDKLDDKLGPIFGQINKIESRLTDAVEESAMDRAEIWRVLSRAGLGRRNDDETLTMPVQRRPDPDADGSF